MSNKSKQMHHAGLEGQVRTGLVLVSALDTETSWYPFRESGRMLAVFLRQKPGKLTSKAQSYKIFFINRVKRFGILSS
jgi:hypothetical protein